MLLENGKSDASSESFTWFNTRLCLGYSLSFPLDRLSNPPKKLNWNQYVSTKFLIHWISKNQQKHLFGEFSNTVNHCLVFQQGSFINGTAKGKSYCET